ncbi:hypothetical protein [Paenibacillus tengchongensis]|uniref:hypothetical protein n=1 Tax=Paenibacillus tengchongensis TaxID=2608684 RepID=UPI00124F7667|nr:hypothetical protein [Paenibacillus tengchongensis]
MDTMSTDTILKLCLAIVVNYVAFWVVTARIAGYEESLVRVRIPAWLSRLLFFRRYSSKVPLFTVGFQVWVYLTFLWLHLLLLTGYVTIEQYLSINLGLFIFNMFVYVGVYIIDALIHLFRR